MARKLDSRKYDDVVGRMEKMSDGAKRHAADAELPKNVLDEARLREAQLGLRDKREEFERLQVLADQAHQQYDEQLKANLKLLSRCADALRGAYGKDSLALQDFGLKPRSGASPKKPPEPTA